MDKKNNPVKIATEDFMIPENSILFYNESVGRYVFYEEDVEIGDHYEHTDMSAVSFSVEFVESNMGILFTTVEGEKEQDKDCDQKEEYIPEEDVKEDEMDKCPGPVDSIHQVTIPELVEAWENAFEQVWNMIKAHENNFDHIFKYIKIK